MPSSGTGSAPAGIPRSDATCAAAVQPAAEVRPQNTTANNSVPSNPSTIPWSTGLNGWPHFVADRDLVTGNYKGTTDEILQWVSCKWGIDINLVRADAWTESNWIQSTVGDSCGTAGGLVRDPSGQECKLLGADGPRWVPLYPGRHGLGCRLLGCSSAGVFRRRVL